MTQNKNVQMQQGDGHLTNNQQRETTKCMAVLVAMRNFKRKFKMMQNLGHKTKLTTGQRVTGWALLAIVRLFVGLATVFLAQVTSFLIHWQMQALNTIAQRHCMGDGQVFAMINLFMAVTMSALCIFVAPKETGSSTPKTKEHLKGACVKKFTLRQLFGVKVVVWPLVWKVP